MDKELYNRKLKEIKTKYTRFNRKMSVGVPVPILIQEAENLYHWCQEDKTALKKAGLDWELVKDIPVRIRLVQELEAKWFIARKTGSHTKKEALEARCKCRELCATLVRDFNYALRGKTNTIKYLSQYIKYRKNINVSFDLRELVVLGKRNTPLLEQINFDIAILDRAKAMAKDLMNKESQDTINIDKSSLQDIYKKTCFHLKDAVSKVRRCGKYVFHGNKERLIGYRSEYRRLHK